MHYPLGDCVYNPIGGFLYTEIHTNFYKYFLCEGQKNSMVWLFSVNLQKILGNYG